MKLPTNKLLATAVFGGMLALSGCGGSKESSSAAGGVPTASKNHLNVSLGAELESLDPQKASDMGAFSIIRQMLLGLTSSDATGKTIPSAAESWTSEGDKVWTFNLRKDMKWSNGDPVTAHDFVYSMRRLTNPETGSPYSGYLVDIKVVGAQEISEGKAKPDTLGVKAIDDHTLQISLKEAVPYLPDLLTLPVTYAVNQKAIEQHGDKWLDPANMVVSGAYKLKEWKLNSHLTIERNPAYYGNDNTKIDTLTFMPVQGANEINRYKAGELDMTTGIPPEQFEKIKQEHPNEVRADPKLCTYYIEYNMLKPPFDNPKVRQAISMVVDRDVMTKQILGRGEISTYQFAPAALQGMTEISPEWTKLDKDGRAAEAKKLLEEAGYNAANPLKFEILYSTSETAKRLTTAAVSMMQQALGNVEVSIVNQEWKTSLDTRRQGKFQSAFAGWCADYNEPSSFYNMFRTGNGNNSGRYSSKEYEALLDQTLQAGITPEQRIELYHQAEKVLQKDNPAIFVYNPVANRLVRTNIEAASLSDPLSNWQAKDWSIK